MVLVKRLASPSFDLCWISVYSKDGEDKQFILVPGGGGSTK